MHIKNAFTPNYTLFELVTEIMEIDNRKCYNCGKKFRTPAELQRHQKRKTPCLIREISEADKNNPNRCIYCNKVMSKKEHLTRHLTKCKVKNGGIQTLYDKVKYEETIRIMKEEQERKDQERERKDQEQERKNQELERKNQELMEEFRKLKEQVEKGNYTIVNNNNTTNNNNTVNNIIIEKLVINDYKHANIAHLVDYDVFSKIFKEHWINTPVALVEKIWFDPKHPENISLHLVNKKNGEMLVVKGNKWATDNTTNIIPEIREFTYSLVIEILRHFSERLSADKIINDFNRDVPGDIVVNRRTPCEWEDGEYFKKLLDGRPISAESIKAKNDQLLE